jgi:hypothetical protein
VREFVEHYHRERNHQGLNNALIVGSPAIGTVGRIRWHPRLGGLLNYYDRAAWIIGSIEQWDITGAITGTLSFSVSGAGTIGGVTSVSQNGSSAMSVSLR